MPKERGLGKGLGALIPSSDGSGGLLDLELDRISPNPRQPRASIEEGALAELADSIRRHGVLEPIIVTRSGNGYTLVAGERRWRAARLAGLRKIPAVVKDASPQELLELALVENIQRQDLSPLEEAAAYRQLLEEHGLTQEEVARRVGKSRSAVANSLRLLNLPPEAKVALEEGRITEGHARTLLSLSTTGEQLALLASLLASGATVREAEEAARRRSSTRKPRGSAHSAELSEIESRLRELLGTRVELHHGRKGGRLVIHFYSDEELEGILRHISAD